MSAVDTPTAQLSEQQLGLMFQYTVDKTSYRHLISNGPSRSPWENSRRTAVTTAGDGAFAKSGLWLTTTTCAFNQGAASTLALPEKKSYDRPDGFGSPARKYTSGQSGAASNWPP